MLTADSINASIEKQRKGKKTLPPPISAQEHTDREYTTSITFAYVKKYLVDIDECYDISFDKYTNTYQGWCYGYLKQDIGHHKTGEDVGVSVTGTELNIARCTEQEGFVECCSGHVNLTLTLESLKF